VRSDRHEPWRPILGRFTIWQPTEQTPVDPRRHPRACRVRCATPAACGCRSLWRTNPSPA